VYEGTPANLQMTGTMAEEAGPSKFVLGNWSAAGNGFHGVWNKMTSTGSSPDLESVTIHVFEGTPRVKCFVSTAKPSWLAIDPATLSLNATGSFGFEIPGALKASGSIGGNTMALVATSQLIGNFAWTGARAVDGMPF
jgi:hypothetical protein